MINTISIYVKSEGIKLPDGSVFGAETCEKYRIVSESGLFGYTVYEVFGSDLLNIFGSGERVTWREMKKAMNERIAYQNSIGNKVVRNGVEITEF